MAEGGGPSGGFGGSVAYGVTAKGFVGGGGDEAALRVVLEISREPAEPHRSGGGGGARRRLGGAREGGVIGIYCGGALKKLGDGGEGRPLGDARGLDGGVPDRGGCDGGDPAFGGENAGPPSAGNARDDVG